MTRKTLSEITLEESYRLDNAEFKGMVIQSLKDIREDVTDIKTQNNVTRWISMGVAGIAGIASGMMSRNIK